MKNNTDSTSKQKKSLTIIAVLLLSLAIFAAPFTGVTFAKAQEPAPDQPTFEYDQLYWFSDNSGSQTYLQQLALAFPQIDMEMYYKAPEIFHERFMLDFLADEFSDVANAYVIFELRSGIYDWVSIAGCALYDVFSYFDGKDCKIMFINGTEELKFYKQNDFLDFVDIHINTDLLTVFLSSLFYKVENDYGDTKFENATFFIDAYFSENVEEGYLSCWFLKDYLMRFIRSAYREEIEFQQKKNYEILREKNIKIICDLGNGSYFDAAYGTFSASNAEDLYERISNDRFYAIGHTKLGSTYSQGWYNLAEDLKAYFNPNMAGIYVYNEAQYTFYDGSVYTQGSGLGLFSQIVSDFIYGNSLITYDNWVGRCEVTHKDIPQGSGGWLYCFGIPAQDASFAEINPYLAFLDAWQIALSTVVEAGHEISDYNYYNNYLDDNGPPPSTEEENN